MTPRLILDFEIGFARSYAAIYQHCPEGKRWGAWAAELRTAQARLA